MFVFQNSICQLLLNIDVDDVAICCLYSLHSDITSVKIDFAWNYHPLSLLFVNVIILITTRLIAYFQNNRVGRTSLVHVLSRRGKVYAELTITANDDNRFTGCFKSIAFNQICLIFGDSRASPVEMVHCESGRLEY